MLHLELGSSRIQLLSVERDFALSRVYLFLFSAELLLLEFKQAIFLGHLSAHTLQLRLLIAYFLLFLLNHLFLGRQALLHLRDLGCTLLVCR